VINVNADQNVAHVNVVTSDKCPFCNCDPCDCNWGINELFEKGNLVAGKSLVEGSLSSSYYPTIEDLRLPAFDSIYNTLGTGGASAYKQRYKSAIVKTGEFKVGDLVNWHPFWGVCDWNKPWIVKAVFAHDPLDCAYYDYEITDGLVVHRVIFSEIKKLEDK
tara:strand:+ start:44 stop:529 length:486 start_codon:yes stop_codon:yes gene_type:complete